MLGIKVASTIPRLGLRILSRRDQISYRILGLVSDCAGAFTPELRVYFGWVTPTVVFLVFETSSGTFGRRKRFGNCRIFHSVCLFSSQLCCWYPREQWWIFWNLIIPGMNQVWWRKRPTRYSQRYIWNPLIRTSNSRRNIHQVVINKSQPHLPIIQCNGRYQSSKYGCAVPSFSRIEELEEYKIWKAISRGGLTSPSSTYWFTIFNLMLAPLGYMGFLL